MPIASTRNRKNVAKPSTTSRSEKAEPCTVQAAAVPPMAISRATIERCPNSFGYFFANSGSRTIRSVPAIVRMISGAKRSRSAPLGAKLAGPGSTRRRLASMNASSRRRQRDTKRSVRFTLIENFQISFRDGGQESLSVHAHPDHHHNERNHARPLARVEVRHVVFDFFAQL